MQAKEQLVETMRPALSTTLFLNEGLIWEDVVPVLMTASETELREAVKAPQLLLQRIDGDGGAPARIRACSFWTWASARNKETDTSANGSDTSVN